MNIGVLLARQRAREMELRSLLNECQRLLVEHHSSRIACFDGFCPVCTDNCRKLYPHDIFGRIEKALNRLGPP